jgi:DmsE family decaheme c-type cytochrome
VNCLTCHSIHKAHAKSNKLLAKPQVDLCATCHSNVVASFKDKPYKHRIGHGVVECSSCHEPHGRAGKDVMKVNRAGEPACLTCHGEKRGPHVFPHLSGGTGDCQSCHLPHGSNYPKQLTRSSVDKLCLECHSPLASGALGSQPVATHNLLTPRWRNCTTCHTAIHGSNRSPKLLK